MDLKRCKVINLVHEDFEDLELWYPTLRLREEGTTVHLVGESGGITYKGKHGVPAVSDFGFAEVRAVHEAGKPIGQICHAGWVLVSAGILKGRRVTSVGAIRDDLANAGALWVDEPVVVDGNLVSSRRPPDLPQYVRAYIELLARR